MFVKKKTQDSTLTEGNEALPDVIEIADDFNSSDGEDDEIEASLKQLFPGKSEVNVFHS